MAASGTTLSRTALRSTRWCGYAVARGRSCVAHTTVPKNTAASARRSPVTVCTDTAQ